LLLCKQRWVMVRRIGRRSIGCALGGCWLCEQGFVVATNSDGRHPVALALEWISKITTVVGMMVVPAVVCWLVDRKFGLNNYLMFGGLVFGFVIGLTYLLRLAKASNRSKSGGAAGESDAGDGR
jgi:F0F1-type ATP synthase assembly protein I